MTRILALGDNQRDPNSRAAEHDRVMDFLAQYVEREKPDAVAHGGDWTERRSTHEDRDYLFRWVRRITNVCPLVGVEGNHEEREFCREFDHIETQHSCLVATTPRARMVAGVEWMLMPWPRREALHAYMTEHGMPTDRESVDLTANEMLKDILRRLGTVAATADPALPRVLVIHAEPSEYKLGADQPMHVAEGVKVTVEDLVHLTGCDAALVSHIHRPDVFTVTRADGVEVPVILVGSPRRTAYAAGELEPKGAVWLEFEGRRLVRWDRIPTPATPMILVEAEWADCGGAWMFVVNGGVGALPGHDGSLRTAEVRFRYSVSPDRREAARAAAIEWKRLAVEIAGAAEVQIEEVVLSMSRARMPELAACATVFDRLRCKWERDGDVDSERAARLVACAESVEGGIS